MSISMRSVHPLASALRNSLLIVLFLTACAPAPAALGTPTSAPPPSTAPSLTPASAPTGTPTPLPSQTPTPPPTQTPTPDYLALTLPKGPTLIINGQVGGMRLFWQWNETTLFRVEWGVDTSYAEGVADVGEYDAENHLYAFDFSGLRADTRYFYRVILNMSAAEGSFRSPPDPGARSLKFICYGDTRTYPDRHDAVAHSILDLLSTDPGYQTFNLFVGDFVTSGDLEEDWNEEFFAPEWGGIRSLLANLPILPAMGNHEGGGHLFLRYFPVPYVRARYGSFDYGPAHITVLDQYVPYGEGSNQRAWLEQDLSASTRPWKFILLHEPGWSAGGGHENNLEIQALQPLFERTGVSVIFAGHNHYYARAVVNGVTHLTVGTGGGPLYTPILGMPNLAAVYPGLGYTRFEIEGDTLTGTFVALDGSIQDSFKIQR